VTVKVDEWTEVRWDASYICRRQGIAGPVNGTVTWGTGDGKVDLKSTNGLRYGGMQATFVDGRESPDLSMVL
jgi:hypothetical protein